METTPEPPSGASAQASSRNRPEAPEAPGYTVDRFLGAGASASVWLLRDGQGGFFALKLPGQGEERTANAFEVRREANILARLQHPNLVRLHAVLETGHGAGLLYEYAPGGSVAQLVAARGSISPGEAVSVLVGIASALGYLHARGTAHGDISPGNILFTAEGRPLLADFGQGRLLGEAGGARGGTPGFEAPETSGRPGAGMLGAAADIYALAAVGWFLLTGHVPPRMRDRPPLSILVPAVGRGLPALLEAGLAEDPAQRPSAEEFAAAAYQGAPAEPVDLTASADPEVLPGLLTRRTRSAAPADAKPQRWERLRRKGPRRRVRPAGPARPAAGMVGNAVGGSDGSVDGRARGNGEAGPRRSVHGSGSRHRAGGSGAGRHRAGRGNGHVAETGNGLAGPPGHAERPGSGQGGGSGPGDDRGLGQLGQRESVAGPGRPPERTAYERPRGGSRAQRGYGTQRGRILSLAAAVLVAAVMVLAAVAVAAPELLRADTAVTARSRPAASNPAAAPEHGSAPKSVPVPTPVATPPQASVTKPADPEASADPGALPGPSGVQGHTGDAEQPTVDSLREQAKAADPAQALPALAALRARAFATADPGLLEHVDAPGSPALQADREQLGRLVRDGHLLRGLTMEVAVRASDASSGTGIVDPAGDAAVKLRVAAATSAYSVEDASQTVVHQEPAQQQEITLVLVRVDGAWKISAVLAPD